MRPLTLALALFLSVLTAFAAEPDNSKSNGATIYEGLALTIADGAFIRRASGRYPVHSFRESSA